MKIKVPEAEILRTPIKIEKLSLWSRTGSGFIMNFEFHGFQRKTYFQKKKENTLFCRAPTGAPRDGRTDGSATRRTGGRTGAPRDGRADGRADGRTNGRADGRTNGRTGFL